MSLALSVENLSKRYTLHHAGNVRPTTLVEAIPMALKGLARRIVHGPESSAHAEDFWALRDVNFELQRGERLGVIGRNGAGKSTMLKLLSRITEPTSGRIRIKGRVASLLEVGTGFNPELTGRENIFLNAAILGMSRREIIQRFDAIVDFAGVERFVDMPVKRYSSGMYMRLAFSVAAHIDPEILIVDEVLAVGDAAFQKKCLEKMGEFGREERTILFVSHNMPAIESLCNRVLYLKSGQVVADSTDVPAIIRQYMGKEGGDEVSAQWVATEGAPVHPSFTPRALRLVNGAGAVINDLISYSDEIWCEIEGDIEDMDDALTMGIAVFSDTGQCLFWSYQSDLAQSEWPSFHPGRNLMRVRLPLDIFNGGQYRLELIGGLHYRQWICEPSVNAPAIFFNLNDRVSESPYWLGKRPTVVAPKLHWTIS
jgi:lipopolysaccharide transport system ATP-binding protein